MEKVYGTEAANVLIEGKYLTYGDRYYKLNREANEIQYSDYKLNNWKPSSITLNQIVKFEGWEEVNPENNIKELKAFIEGKTLKSENGFYKIDIKTNEVQYSTDNHNWSLMNLEMNHFLKEGKYTVIE
ncbi:hypothetical protein U8V72_21215 [Priestia filamentosa]|uniref:hypothetical protein n=1 Tax=Priestia filamentosa TaxID=1402861 RepID=UPI00397C423E